MTKLDIDTNNKKIDNFRDTVKFIPFDESLFEE